MDTPSKTEKTCASCGGKVWARGLCGKHYQGWRKSNPGNIRKNQKSGPCSVDGCERKYFAKGKCRFHYMRARDGIEEDRSYRSRGRRYCVVDGCDRFRSYANGLCDAHEGRRKRTGVEGGLIGERVRIMDRLVPLTKEQSERLTSEKRFLVIAVNKVSHAYKFSSQTREDLMQEAYIYSAWAIQNGRKSWWKSMLRWLAFRGRSIESPTGYESDFNAGVTGVEEDREEGHVGLAA